MELVMKIKLMFLALLAVKSFAFDNQGFLSLVAQKMQIETSKTACPKVHLDKEFASLKDLKEMDLIEFSQRATDVCHMNPVNRKTLRNVVLLDIAKEYYPETNWSTEVLLKGWSGWSGGKTELKLKDIYR